MKIGIVRWPNAVARAQKIRLGKNQGGRQTARADQFARSVAVGQNSVDKRGALDQSRLQRAPLLRRDDERDGVHLPRLFHAACIGFSMNVISDTLLVEETTAGLAAASEFRRA